MTDKYTSPVPMASSAGEPVAVYKGAGIEAQEELMSALEGFDYGTKLYAGAPPATLRQAVKRAREERDELADVLMRNGFVRCDIAACNCGSWHARYGLPQRMYEIKEALSDAGHPLCNENGNLVLNALKQLIAERDALRADAERYKWLRDVGDATWRPFGIREGYSAKQADAAKDAL